jgi:CRP-like cAMP-binding protein
MLPGNHFLDTLPDNVRRKLSFQLQPVHLPKRTQLSFEGEMVDTIYFPVSAVISKYQTTAEGHTIEVALAGREGGVGLAAAASASEAISASEVLLAGAVLKVGSANFNMIAETEPQLSSAAVGLIDDETKRKTRRLICNRYHNVEQRFCTWLLTLADRSGKTKLRVTQEEIARALGVHRPTVTDASQILRAHGMIGHPQGVVNILDPDKLESAACECREALRVVSRQSAITQASPAF